MSPIKELDPTSNQKIFEYSDTNEFQAQGPRNYNLEDESISMDGNDIYLRQHNLKEDEI